MSAKAITLRLARPQDAPVLAIMSRDLIETGLGWQYHAERIRRLIDSPETLTLVACEREYDRERVAGFAIMEFGEERSNAGGDERAHLLLLAVRPAYQRRGIGRRLIEWLLDSAATAGMASIHLELRAGKAAARAFYRTLGFTETIVVPGYYRRRESALRMVRVLRAPGLPPVTWQPPTLGGR